MMGPGMVIDWKVIGTVLAFLFMFAFVYNHFVTQLGELSEGYVSLLVAAGVLVVLIGLAVIWWQAAVIALACFVAAGAPMIVGDIARHVQAREAAKRRMREESRE